MAAENGRHGKARAVAARWSFWLALGALAVVWTVCVYLPDRVRLREARGLRAELSRDVDALTREVTSLSKSEQLLAADAPYLWERVVRARLNWTAPGEHTLDEEP